MTDIEAMQRRIDALEIRLADVERSSWMVATTLWKRALAVTAHAVVGYILVALAFAFVLFVINLLATATAR